MPSASQASTTAVRIPEPAEVSPLRSDVFIHYLDIYGLHSKYPSLARSLIYGFEIGSPMPAVPWTQPFIPPNHYRSRPEEVFVASYYDKEVKEGTMIGPFDLATIAQVLGTSAFYCSPIATVPKSGEDLFRVVRDMSFGDGNHPSPNSLVDKAHFRWVDTWTSAHELEEWVSASFIHHPHPPSSLPLSLYRDYSFLLPCHMPSGCLFIRSFVCRAVPYAFGLSRFVCRAVCLRAIRSFVCRAVPLCLWAVFFHFRSFFIRFHLFPVPLSCHWATLVAIEPYQFCLMQ